MGLILALGRSGGEGEGNSLQYSCLGNPMDRGAWWATVHSLASQGSNPGLPHWGGFFTSWATGEAGLQRVGQDWSNLTHSHTHTHTHTHTELINSDVLVSDVQPSDSVIHIHIPVFVTLFRHLDCSRILSRVPCAFSRSLLVIHLILFLLKVEAKLLAYNKT